MTVRVNLKVLSYLPDYKGPRETEVELPSDINQAINQLMTGPCKELKKDFGLFHYLLINGRNYRFVLKERTELAEGDTLTFVSMVSGG